MSEPKIPSVMTVLFRCEVGSTVHGCGVEDQDDRDEMGVLIPHRAAVLGLQSFEQYQWRTQPVGVRSGPGDLDLVMYAARKWMRLALAGNPTVLLPLFVPETAVMRTTFTFEKLRNNTERFIGRHVAGRYLGYMNSQLEQLQGLRGSRHTNRPELVAKYGYDTKFAYHAIRLGLQGVEILSTGKLTLPIEDRMRAILVSVRRGGYTLREVLEWGGELQAQLVELRGRKGLPQSADHLWADQWLIRAHEAAWRGGA